MKREIKMFFALLITLFTVFTMLKVTSNAAGTTGITQLCIGSGEKAVKKIKENGFKPCYQNINCMDDTDNKVCIGYKKGSGTPITNIIVSEENASQITFNNVEYKQVSNVAINTGSNLAPVFLYYTTDKAAGDDLKGISFNTYNPNSLGKNKSEGFALLNDGSEPVRSAQGNVSYNFANDNNEFLYIMMIKNNIYKPFVKDVHMALGDSKRNCIEALSAKGCNYYCEDTFGTTKSKEFMMIGYTKTKNEAEALKNIITLNDPNSMMNISEIKCNEASYKACDTDAWADYNQAIYITYDEKAGKAIRDIYSADYDGEKTSVKDYTKSFATKNKRSLAVSATLKDDDYMEDIEDKSEIKGSAVPYFNGVGIESSNIVGYTSSKTEDSPWNVNAEKFKAYLTEIRTETPANEQQEKEVEETFEKVDSNKKESDEKLENEEQNKQQEQTDQEENDDKTSEDNEGSIFGNSKTGHIIIAIMIACVGVGVLIYKKKGSDKNEGK